MRSGSELHERTSQAEVCFSPCALFAFSHFSWINRSTSSMYRYTDGAFASNTDVFFFFMLFSALKRSLIVAVCLITSLGPTQTSKPL